MLVVGTSGLVHPAAGLARDRDQLFAKRFRDPIERVLIPATGAPQEGKRLGSVGRMMPGITARIVDPDTFAEKPLTETGMPIDDPRWEEMFSRLLNYARDNGIEVQSWNGGSHWTLHNNAINIVPNWHQNKTMDPQVAGVMKASAGVAKATRHDDGPGWAPAGTPITITVYARGYLAAPVTLTITSSNGGTLSKTQVTIPAGANKQDTFTFTPGSNRVTTLTYTASGGATPAR